jgi:hypothetical protein
VRCRGPLAFSHWRAHKQSSTQVLHGPGTLTGDQPRVSVQCLVSSSGDTAECAQRHCWTAKRLSTNKSSSSGLLGPAYHCFLTSRAYLGELAGRESGGVVLLLSPAEGTANGAGVCGGAGPSSIQAGEASRRSGLKQVRQSPWNPKNPQSHSHSHYQRSRSASFVPSLHTRLLVDGTTLSAALHTHTHTSLLAGEPLPS